MLASGLRTYADRYAVVPGRRVALFVSNDDRWRTATDLGGVGVAAVILALALSHGDACVAVPMLSFLAAILCGALFVCDPTFM
ncbi:MAG TPA: hypothetical protein VH678_12095 [Xanthobacteraceae bacterium]|jgi:hypothetical protein